MASGDPTESHSGGAGAPAHQRTAPTNPEPRSFMQQRKPWTVQSRTDTAPRVAPIEDRDGRMASTWPNMLAVRAPAMAEDRRSAPTQPALRAVRPGPPSSENWIGDRTTPVDHGFLEHPGLYRSRRTPVPASEPPMSDGTLAALTTATTAIVNRHGSVSQEALVATLMVRGISRMDALYVIRAALRTGAIARFADDPLHLRAPAPASTDSGDWFPR